MSVQKVDKTTGNTTLIAGATLWADSPIGTILAYGGATAPSGWMLCQGQELTKTDYAELYAVIGDSFGTASVNTKFVLPDLREATTKGVGLTGKSNNHYDADGVALGEFVEDRVQTHNHPYNNNGQGNNMNVYDGYPAQLSNMGSWNSGSSLAVSNPTIGNNSGRSGATTEVKAVGVNFIIKAKQVALPADLESAVEDAVEEVYGDIIPSSASSSNKVLVNSDKTSSVTSGSTAPITSGGVWDVAKDVIGTMSESDKKWEGHVPYYGARRFTVSIYTSQTTGVYDFYYRPYNDLKKVTYIAGDNQSPTFNVTSLGNDNYSITATVSGQTVTTAYFI